MRRRGTILAGPMRPPAESRHPLAGECVGELLPRMRGDLRKLTQLTKPILLFLVRPLKLAQKLENPLGSLERTGIGALEEPR